MKRMYLFGLVMLLALGLALQAIPALAQTEVVFLTNSRIGSSGEVGQGTRLFRVDFDETSSQANLTLIYLLPAPNFDQVDALACTLDGMKVYAVDKNTGSLGYYEPTINAFHDTGNKVKLGGSIVQGIVLAAFGPGGQLYVASQSTSHIYTVDIATGAATDLGHAGVTLSGADLVFDVSGNLYLFTNSTVKLYQITLGTPNIATEVVALSGTHFTGMAMRANGTGNFLCSRNGTPGIIQEFDSFGVIRTYNMYRDGSPYSYWSGDMSIGPLRACSRTIGYWKQDHHDWTVPYVTISCAGDIYEAEGKDMIWGARGKNYSMLVAQLIAAKINVGNAPGYDVINDAETFLCSKISDFSGEWWNSPILKADKPMASHWVEELTTFNQGFECEY